MYRRQKYVERKDLLDSKTYKTDILGEFVDRELEEDFNNADGFFGYRVRKIILAFSILYLLLLAFDYSYFDTTIYFIKSLVVRSTIMLFSVIVYNLLPRMKKINTIYLCLTIFELLLIFSYQFILYQDGLAGDFVEQAMAFMLIIICLFLVPNRWVYSVMVALLVVTSFLLIYNIFPGDLKFYVIVEVGIYLIVAIVVCGYCDYSIRYYKREQYAKEQMLKEMMMTDQLTGANNRIKFDEELHKCCNKELAEFDRYAIAMFDLDHFKVINDRFGHMAGDNVLKEFVRRVYANIRIEDIFARWGGEEFVVIIVDAEAKEAINFVQRIRQVIAETEFGEVGHVTVSAGVTVVLKGDDPDSVMRRVDHYLYLAKETGRNKVIHDSSSEAL